MQGKLFTAQIYYIVYCYDKFATKNLKCHLSWVTKFGIFAKVEIKMLPINNSISVNLPIFISQVTHQPQSVFVCLVKTCEQNWELNGSMENLQPSVKQLPNNKFVFVSNHHPLTLSFFLFFMLNVLIWRWYEKRGWERCSLKLNGHAFYDSST